LIRRGLLALGRAQQLGGAEGPYRFASGDCRVPRAGQDRRGHRLAADAALYARLVLATQSPIVELNRPWQWRWAEGPQAGLYIVDALVHEPALASYHLLPSVRGDLLEKLGRRAEAAQEFERAASADQKRS